MMSTSMCSAPARRSPIVTLEKPSAKTRAPGLTATAASSARRKFTLRFTNMRQANASGPLGVRWLCAPKCDFDPLNRKRIGTSRFAGAGGSGIWGMRKPMSDPCATLLAFVDQTSPLILPVTSPQGGMRETRSQVRDLGRQYAGRRQLIVEVEANHEVRVLE